MKIILSLLVITAISLVNAIHKLPFTTEEYEDNILVLNDANFDEEIKNYDILMVDFAVPWCTYCKKLYPEYMKASITLR